MAENEQTPADDATAPVEAAEAADGMESTDPKERFRAALERKKAASHRTANGSQNTGAVHGSESKGPAQRSFRRRAGSA